MNQTARVNTNLHVLKPETQTEKTKKKRRAFSLSRSRLPFVIITLLLVYLAVIFTSQFSSIASMKREVTIIEHEITEMKQRNEYLQGELRNIRSDAYIEKTAREQLGLVKNGETRVIVVPATANGL